MFEEFTLPKPKLRNKLPDDVIWYIEKSYPARMNEAGIKQNDSIDYITEERSFLQDPAVIKCVEKYGLQPIGLLWFLRLYMAKELGWGVDVSTEKKRKIMAFEICTNYNISNEEFDKWSDALLECEIILVVDGSDEKTYWTTLQQFYDFERKSWTRLRNNAAKRKSQWEDNFWSIEDSAPCDEISEMDTEEKWSLLPDNPFFND